MPQISVQAPPLPEPRICFVASLSNGETIVEGKGSWTWIDGKPSPWTRLIRYAIENKTPINSLSLLAPGGAVFTLPIAGGKPRFAGFAQESLEKPIDYEVKRYIARDMDVLGENNNYKISGVDISDFYTIAEAMYKDYTLQIWVNELNPKISYVVYKRNQ